jgi:hypothetical protein
MSYSIIWLHDTMQGLRTQKLRGHYCMIVNPNADDFAQHVADFIRYEHAHGRKVRFRPRTFNATKLLQCTPETGNAIRPNDPRFAIHSTTLAAYANILRDGCLKSTTQLRKDGTNQHAIGFLPLGEPPDYLDYVMLAPLDDNGSGPEIVVNSHLRGEICMDPHVPYQPQARLYFDAHRIIADGFAVRDGAHVLKVHGQLPLEGYWLQTVLASDIPLPAGNEHWTPALFGAAANTFFMKNQNLKD